MPSVRQNCEDLLLVDNENSLEAYRLLSAKVQMQKNQLLKQIGHFRGPGRPSAHHALLHSCPHQMFLQINQGTQSNAV